VAAAAAHTKQELQAAFSQAPRTDGPTLIAVPIQHQLRPLVPPVGTA
jgi:thiamine pyrophosphate-dependent acetolactate synthase large subunit-like protein